MLADAPVTNDQWHVLSLLPVRERTVDDNPPPGKRKKDKEKQKSGKVLVSFDVEEGGEDSPVASRSQEIDGERRKKWRSKEKEPKKNEGREVKRKEEPDDDHCMWVEKAVPEVV